MSMEGLLSNYIGELKSKMNDLAHGAAKLPKSKPFEHGVQVGNYQGLEAALRYLEALIEDDAERERKK